MTIKTKNHIVISFITLALLVFSIMVTLFVIQNLNGNYENLYNHKFFSAIGFSFFAPNEKTVVISMLYMSVYVCATLFMLYFSFEKTSSALAVYLAIYLFGSMLELSRFFILIFGFEKTFSDELLLLGRLCMLGKFLCFSSFFFGSFECQKEQKFDIEKNLILLVLISVFAASCVPLNTSITTLTYSVKWGFSTIIYAILVFTALFTITNYVIAYKDTKDKSYLKLCLWFFTIIVGEHIVTSSAILAPVVPGCALMTIGTTRYIREVHKMALWG